MRCILCEPMGLSKVLSLEYPDHLYAPGQVFDVDDEELILCIGPGVIPEPGQVMELARTIAGRFDAGLVSGIEEGRQEYLVDDIYSPKEYSVLKGGGILPVDIVSKRFFICRGKAWKEIEWCEPFGLSLRKLGYQNYINTNIEIGERSAENYNAEGERREWENDMGKGASC